MVSFRHTVKILTRILILAAVMLMFQKCKKGDTGPAGTANVLFSDWYTPTTYIKDTIFGIWNFTHNREVPELTSSIIDSGTVITFGKLLGYNPAVWPTSQVAALPVQLTYNSGGTTTDTWSALVTPGNLTIRFVNDKNTYNIIANAHQFRYIIIPGGNKIARSSPLVQQLIADQTGTSMRRSSDVYSTANYKELCRLLSIPD